MERSVATLALTVAIAFGAVACSDGSLHELGRTGSSVAPAVTDETTDGGATTTASVVVEPQMIRFLPQSFVDPQANNTTAITLLVPEGWNANGSVVWSPYWERLAFLQTHVDDPTSGINIDWLPIQDFMYFQPPAGFSVTAGGNYQGKAYVAPITDPVQFVTQYWIPNNWLTELGGLQPTSVVEQPAIAAEFVKGFGKPADAHGWRLRYSYTLNGQPWERDVSFAILVDAGPAVTSWYVNFAHTESGPAGSLDANAGVISTVVASRISTPEWEGIYRLSIQLFIKGIQQQMADTVRFGQLLAQYRAESQQLQQQVIDERWAQMDEQSQLVGQILEGTQTFSDPTGQLVELPSTWDTYWVNGNGEYIAVDDPNFDPNTLNDGTWQQLTATP